jgi:hypothetical protein
VFVLLGHGYCALLSLQARSKALAVAFKDLCGDDAGIAAVWLPRSHEAKAVRTDPNSEFFPDDVVVNLVAKRRMLRKPFARTFCQCSWH